MYWKVWASWWNVKLKIKCNVNVGLCVLNYIYTVLMCWVYAIIKYYFIASALFLFTYWIFTVNIHVAQYVPSPFLNASTDIHLLCISLFPILFILCTQAYTLLPMLWLEGGGIAPAKGEKTLAKKYGHILYNAEFKILLKICFAMGWLKRTSIFRSVTSSKKT